jgi:2-phosphosulfolactate phosphatase
LPSVLYLRASGIDGVARTAAGLLKAVGDLPTVISRVILSGAEVERFYDPARPYLHPEDVDIALDIDR